MVLRLFILISLVGFLSPRMSVADLRLKEYASLINQLEEIADKQGAVHPAIRASAEEWLSVEEERYGRVLAEQKSMTVNRRDFADKRLTINSARIRIALEAYRRLERLYFKQMPLILETHELPEFPLGFQRSLVESLKLINQLNLVSGNAELRLLDQMSRRIAEQAGATMNLLSFYRASFEEAQKLSLQSLGAKMVQLGRDFTEHYVQKDSPLERKSLVNLTALQLDACLRAVRKVTPENALLRAPRSQITLEDRVQARKQTLRERRNHIAGHFAFWAAAIAASSVEIYTSHFSPEMKASLLVSALMVGSIPGLVSMSRTIQIYGQKRRAITKHRSDQETQEWVASQVKKNEDAIVRGFAAGVRETLPAHFDINDVINTLLPKDRCRGESELTS